MSQILNAIQMLNYLNTGNKYTVKELSKKIGITERMVRYYKVELEQAGIPIETFMGPNGGYYIINIKNQYNHFNKYDIQLLENINTILEKLKYEDISNFLIEFSKAIDDASNNVPYYKILGLKNMNKINITCIPWITFSNFKDAITFNEKNSKPKICWGKYYLDDDRYLIDISLLVNHAFQDGYHMGLFFNNLQENIYNLKIDKNLVKVR